MLFKVGDIVTHESRGIGFIVNEPREFNQGVWCVVFNDGLIYEIHQSWLRLLK